MKDLLHIVFNDDFVVSVTDFTLFYSYIEVTRPPRSQSGAIFFTQIITVLCLKVLDNYG